MIIIILNVDQHILDVIMTQRSTMFFGGKTGLAPMVRVGTVHSRIQSLRNGADFVWSEELIDIKLSTCKRVFNNKTKTTDFLLEHDTSVRPVFETCEEERGKVILQLGQFQKGDVSKRCHPLKKVTPPPTTHKTKYFLKSTKTIL